MADLTNPLNKTFTVDSGEVQCSHGIADCWHGIVEKQITQQNGMAGHTTQIRVEVKSLTDLIARCDQSFLKK